MSDVKHTLRQVPAGDGPLQGPVKFYKAASPVSVAGGYGIVLDGRNVWTPAKARLIVPSAPLADAVAAEWNAQGERIDAASMPLTRYANTAIDNVRGRETDIVGEIVHFAANDLLCYRAERPESLVGSQREIWDPLLAWAEKTFDARIVRAAGVMHREQPEESVSAMRAAVAAYDAFGLTALHNMTTLTGSAILALAVARKFLSVGSAWCAAHVDEDWQIGRWGADEEAAARRAYRKSEFEAACRFLAMLED